MTTESMRCQSTALTTLPEKALIEALKAEHKTTLSGVLRAGLLALASLPRLEQGVWIKMAENNSQKTLDNNSE